jgi:hypothetical protein
MALQIGVDVQTSKSGKVTVHNMSRGDAPSKAEALEAIGALEIIKYRLTKQYLGENKVEASEEGDDELDDDDDEEDE